MSLSVYMCVCSEIFQAACCHLSMTVVTMHCGDQSICEFEHIRILTEYLLNSSAIQPASRGRFYLDCCYTDLMVSNGTTWCIYLAKMYTVIFGSIYSKIYKSLFQL